jgi:hypothetical protein
VRLLGIVLLAAAALAVGMWAANRAIARGFGPASPARAPGRRSPHLRTFELVGVQAAGAVVLLLAPYWLVDLEWPTKLLFLVVPATAFGVVAANGLAFASFRTGRATPIALTRALLGESGARVVAALVAIYLLIAIGSAVNLLPNGRAGLGRLAMLAAPVFAGAVLIARVGRRSSLTIRVAAAVLALGFFAKMPEFTVPMPGVAWQRRGLLVLAIVGLVAWSPRRTLAPLAALSVTAWLILQGLALVGAFVPFADATSVFGPTAQEPWVHGVRLDDLDVFGRPLFVAMMAGPAALGPWTVLMPGFLTARLARSERTAARVGLGVVALVAFGVLAAIAVDIRDPQPFSSYFQFLRGWNRLVERVAGIGGRHFATLAVETAVVSVVATLFVAAGSAARTLLESVTPLRGGRAVQAIAILLVLVLFVPTIADVRSGSWWWIGPTAGTLAAAVTLFASAWALPGRRWARRWLFGVAVLLAGFFLATLYPHASRALAALRSDRSQTAPAEFVGTAALLAVAIWLARRMLDRWKVASPIDGSAGGPGAEAPA